MRVPPIEIDATPRATTGIDMQIDYCSYGQGSGENLPEGL